MQAGPSFSLSGTLIPLQVTCISVMTTGPHQQKKHYKECESEQPSKAGPRSLVLHLVFDMSPKHLYAKGVPGDGANQKIHNGAQWGH